VYTRIIEIYVQDWIDHFRIAPHDNRFDFVRLGFQSPWPIGIAGGSGFEEAQAHKPDCHECANRKNDALAFAEEQSFDKRAVQFSRHDGLTPHPEKVGQHVRSRQHKSLRKHRLRLRAPAGQIAFELASWGNYGRKQLHGVFAT